ncbi:MAG TPA: redoxin family protein [Longimicrobiales bacterium]|nr:redoxin family protein [Longimicrobiales bacterium]
MTIAFDTSDQYIRNRLAPEDTAPPAGLWQRITKTIDDGDTVLLPSVDEHQPRQRSTRGMIAAAIILIALTSLLIPKRVVEAESSELRIGPNKPTAGATLTLTYRPTSRLSGEKQLHVRARYRTGPGPSSHTIDVGNLKRERNGVFTGSVTLPDSAVYAVFAVENATASTVDDHGESWDVVVHGADGKPLANGLLARADDSWMRNSRIQLETLQQLTTVHPDYVAGWFRMYAAEQESLGRKQLDSLKLRYRPILARLASQISANPNPGDDNLASLVFFADILGDTTTKQIAEARLISLYPKTIAAVQRLVFRFGDTAKSKAEFMQAMDSLYRAVGYSPQLNFTAYNTAVEMNDPALIQLWVDRDPDKNPMGYVSAADAYLKIPQLREEGVRRMDQDINDAQSGKMFSRPLNTTVADYERMKNNLTANLATRFASGLVQIGDTARALATLEKHGDNVWNATRFKLLADILYARHDARAAGYYAKVLADPSTNAATVEQARTRAGDAQQIEQARNEMHRYYRATMLARYPMREEATVRKADGTTTTVKFAGDSPTLVAFWSENCPPSVMQLGALGKLVERAKKDGVRVVIVTDNNESGAAERLAKERGLNAPVLFDVDRQMRVAFDNTGTPRYILLDKEGRIRFSDYMIEQLPAKLETIVTLSRK